MVDCVYVASELKVHVLNAGSDIQWLIGGVNWATIIDMIALTILVELCIV